MKVNEREASVSVVIYIMIYVHYMVVKVLNLTVLRDLVLLTDQSCLLFHDVQ